MHTQIEAVGTNACNVPFLAETLGQVNNLMLEQSATTLSTPPVIERDPVAVLDQLSPRVQSLQDEIGKVIVGQEDIIAAALYALFCRGHCLLVGVPGLAKTLLVHALARSLELSFSRIQFTPDLMPFDITGTEILEEDTSTGHRRFVFARGPVFA